MPQMQDPRDEGEFADFIINSEGTHKWELGGTGKGFLASGLMGFR